MTPNPPFLLPTPKITKTEFHFQDLDIEDSPMCHNEALVFSQVLQTRENAPTSTANLTSAQLLSTPP